MTPTSCSWRIFGSIIINNMRARTERHRFYKNRRIFWSRDAALVLEEASSGVRYRSWVSKFTYLYLDLELTVIIPDDLNGNHMRYIYRTNARVYRWTRLNGEKTGTAPRWNWKMHPSRNACIRYKLVCMCDIMTPNQYKPTDTYKNKRSVAETRLGTDFLTINSPDLNA